MDITMYALVEALPALLRSAALHGFDPSLPGLLLGVLGGWFITGAMQDRQMKKEKIRRQTRDKRD